jgi:hypothetical protein
MHDIRYTEKIDEFCAFLSTLSDLRATLYN